MLSGLLLQFAMVETVLTGAMDQFPQFRRYKTFVVLVICAFFFLLGLPLTCSVSTVMQVTCMSGLTAFNCRACVLNIGCMAARLCCYKLLNTYEFIVFSLNSSPIVYNQDVFSYLTKYCFLRSRLKASIFITS